MFSRRQPTTPWDQYSAQGMVGTQAATMAEYYAQAGDQYAAYYAGTEYAAAAAAAVGGQGTTQSRCSLDIPLKFVFLVCC